MTYRFAARSGSSIHVEEQGHGPLVLALHGLGGGAYFFHGVAQRLQERCRLVAIDLPGTGASRSGAAILSAERWIDDLSDLIVHRLEQPVIVVGHSLGTILALKLWAAIPQSIRALAFVCGLPEVRPLIHERLSTRVDLVERSGGLDGMGATASTGVFSPASMSGRPELVGMFERLFEAQVPAVYTGCARILLSATATSIVPTVRVPCVAITGADDQYAPPDAVAAFAALCGVACPVTVLPDCGHQPFFEAPDQFASVLGAFIDQMRAS